MLAVFLFMSFDEVVVDVVTPLRRWYDSIEASVGPLLELRPPP